MPPPTPKTSKAPVNKLLAALPDADYKKVEPHLEECKLERDQILWEMDEVREHVYFPIDSMICLLYETENGISVEVGMTGRQGMVGVVTFIGDAKMAKRAVVQNAGRACRISGKEIERLLKESEALKDICLSYTQALLAQISQNAICNRLHSVDKQVSRYFLSTYDCLGTRQFTVTHMQIANTLGVRRETVSVAARELQDQGLIEYSRGNLKILDRPGLMAVTCECYDAVREQYKRILKDYISEHDD
ncbi:MAG: Crp/Fnr family transcriptional regulator [Pyrinomonadaceae bacterium]